MIMNVAGVEQAIPINESFNQNQIEISKRLRKQISKELKQKERFRKHWNSAKLAQANEALAEKYKAKTAAKRLEKQSTASFDTMNNAISSPHRPGSRGRTVQTNPDARDFPPLDINTPLRRTRSLREPKQNPVPPKKGGSFRISKPSPPSVNGAKHKRDNAMPRRAMPHEQSEEPAVSRNPRPVQAWSNEPAPISDRGDWLAKGGPETTHNVQPLAPAISNRLFQPSDKHTLGRPSWDSSVHSSEDSGQPLQVNESLETFDSANRTWPNESSPREAEENGDRESMRYTLMMQKVPQRKIEEMLGEAMPFNERANPTHLNNPRIPTPRAPSPHVPSPRRKMQQLNRTPSPPLTGSPQYLHSASMSPQRNRALVQSEDMLHKSTSVPVHAHAPSEPAPYASIGTRKNRIVSPGSQDFQEWRRAQKRQMGRELKQSQSLFAPEAHDDSRPRPRSRFPDLVPPPKDQEQVRPERPKLNLKEKIRVKQMRLNRPSNIKFAYGYGSSNPHKIPVTARKLRKKQIQKEKKKEKERLYWAFKEVEFRHQRRAAILIQAAWRGHLTRQLIFPWIHSRWTAVIKIQSAWRGAKPRPEFRKMLLAHRAEKAATNLQRLFRGYQVRRLIQTQRLRSRSPATFCVLERSTVDIEMVEDLRTPAIAIQRQVRAFLARKQYQESQQAVLRVQQAWRCHQANVELQKRKDRRDARNLSATVLQCLFRQKSASNELSQKKREYASAVAIQNQVRSKAARGQLQSLKKVRDAAIKLQSLQRSKMAQVLADYLRKQNKAALLIQCAQRQKAARHARREKEDSREALRQQQENAAVRLQCWSRQQQAKEAVGLLREEKQRRDIFLLKTKTATAIQAAFRGKCDRKEATAMREERDLKIRKAKTRARREKAATKIQAAQRGHVTRNRVETAKRIERARKERSAAALKIQTAQRRRAAKKYVENKRRKAKVKREREAATQKIQSAFRGHRARKQYLAERSRKEALKRKEASRLERERAATQIESAYRGHVARRKVDVLKRKERLRKKKNAAAWKIQCAVRQWIARRRLSVLQDKKRLEDNSATKIQSLYRQKAAKSKVSTIRKTKRENDAATIIQTRQRHRASKAYVAKKRKEELERRAATVLQCAVRSRSARTLAARLRLAHKLHLERVRTARTCQRISEEKERIDSATRLQCAQRKKAACAKVAALRQEKLERDSALTLQCSWRGYVARKQTNHLRQAKLEQDSALVIQSSFRQASARWQLHSLKAEKAQQEMELASALQIQCAWRQHDARRRRSEVKMERVRMAMKYTRTLNSLRDHESAKQIQRIARGRSARKRARRLRRMKNENQAATKINNVARQKIARRRFADAKEDKKRADAATKIQSVQRQKFARKRFANKKQEKKENEAATKIQSHQRKMFAKRKLEALRKEQEKVVAAWRIQCAVRQHFARNKLHDLHEEQRHKAAIKIQAACRQHLAKVDAYNAQIQKNLMTTTLRRQHSNELLHDRLTVRVAGKVRKNHAAHVIQRTYRWYRDHPRTRRQKSLDRLECRLQARKVDFLLRQHSARCIQREFRDYLQREHMKKVQAFTELRAARHLQRAYRQWDQSQKVKQFSQKRAASIIQECYRQRLHRKKVQSFTDKRAASCIQRYGRLRVHNKNVEDLRRRRAARCLQRHLQSHVLQQKCRREIEHNAAACIQKAVRHWLERCRIETIIEVLTEMYLESQRQKSTREKKVREFTEHRAACHIQRAYRAHTSRPRIRRQRSARRLDQRLRLRKADHLRQVHAVKVIERFYYQYSALPRVQRQRCQLRLQNRLNKRKAARICLLHAIRVIQRAWRRHRSSLSTLRSKSAQRLESRLHQRKVDHLIRNNTAKSLQRVARKWLVGKAVDEFARNCAAKRIQCCARQRLHRKSVEDFIQKRSVRSIQSHYRDHLAKKRLKETTETPENEEFLDFKFQSEGVQVGDESSFYRNGSPPVSENFLGVHKEQYLFGTEVAEIYTFSDPSCLPVGAVVMAKFLGLDTRKGKIIAVNSDDSYHILFDHGAKELYVKPSFVEPVNGNEDEKAHLGEDSIPFEIETTGPGDQSAAVVETLAPRKSSFQPKIADENLNEPLPLLTPAKHFLASSPGQVSFCAHCISNQSSVNCKTVDLATVHALENLQPSSVAHEVSGVSSLKSTLRLKAEKPVDFKRVINDSGQIIDVFMERKYVACQPKGPVSAISHSSFGISLSELDSVLPHQTQHYKRVMNMFGKRVFVDITENPRNGTHCLRYLFPEQSHTGTLLLTAKDFEDLGIKDIKSVSTTIKLNACHTALLNRGMGFESLGKPSLIEHQVSAASDLSQISPLPLSTESLDHVSLVSHQVSVASAFAQLSTLPLSIESLGHVSPIGHQISSASDLGQLSTLPLSVESLGPVSPIGHQVSSAFPVPRLSTLPLSMETLGPVSFTVHQVCATSSLRQLAMLPLSVESLGSVSLVEHKVSVASNLPQFSTLPLAVDSFGPISPVGHQVSSTSSVSFFAVPLSVSCFGMISSVAHEASNTSSLAPLSTISLCAPSLGAVSSCNFHDNSVIAIQAGNQIPVQKTHRKRCVMNIYGKRLFVDLVEEPNTKAISIKYMDPLKSRSQSLSLAPEQLVDLGVKQVQSATFEAKLQACKLALLTLVSKETSEISPSSGSHIVSTQSSILGESVPETERALIQGHCQESLHSTIYDVSGVSSWLHVSPVPLSVEKCGAITSCNLVLAAAVRIEAGEVPQLQLFHYKRLMSAVGQKVMVDLTEYPSQEQISIKYMDPVTSQAERLDLGAKDFDSLQLGDILSSDFETKIDACQLILIQHQMEQRRLKWKGVFRIAGRRYLAHVTEYLAFGQEDAQIKLEWVDPCLTGSKGVVNVVQRDFESMDSQSDMLLISKEGKLQACKTKLAEELLITKLKKQLSLSNLSSLTLTQVQDGGSPFNSTAVTMDPFDITGATRNGIVQSPSPVGFPASISHQHSTSSSIVSLPPVTCSTGSDPNERRSLKALVNINKAAQALLKTSTFERPDWVSKPDTAAKTISFLYSSKNKGIQQIALTPLLQQSELGFIYVGRSSKHSEFIVKHPSISRRHACLSSTPSGQLFVTELGSTHGTKVNRIPLEANKIVELKDGDKVQFGTSPGKYLVKFGFEIERSIDDGEAERLARENRALKKKLKKAKSDMHKQVLQEMAQQGLLHQSFSTQDARKDIQTAPAHSSRHQAQEKRANRTVAIGEGVAETKEFLAKPYI